MASTLDQHLLWGIGIRGNQQFLHNEPMTYSRARQLLHEFLQSAGVTHGDFGLHSLRSGGVTAAANAGVPDRLFKRHGGWRSEQAKDGYLKESMEDLLAVSKAVAL